MIKCCDIDAKVTVVMNVNANCISSQVVCLLEAKS